MAHGGRRAAAGHDLEYFADHGGSVWRPGLLLDELEREPGFQYHGGLVVERFRERDDVVEVECRTLGGGDSRRFGASRLLLAAGAIGSARVALASLAAAGARTPLLCNPYAIVAALDLSRLGQPDDGRPRHSLAQLAAVVRHPRDADAVVASLFTYRSLHLFRLARELPLPPAAAMLAARLVATSLLLVGVHQSDRGGETRFLELLPGDERTVLRVGWSRDGDEALRVRRGERAVVGALLRLGCLPLGIRRPLPGASIHYAGTLPMTAEGPPLTCDADGRLRPTRRVFVADGSTWRFLPAKSPTLSFMANARRVAAAAVRDAFPAAVVVR